MIDRVCCCRRALNDLLRQRSLTQPTFKEFEEGKGCEQNLSTLMTQVNHQGEEKSRLLFVVLDHQIKKKGTG